MCIVNPPHVYYIQYAFFISWHYLFSFLSYVYCLHHTEQLAYTGLVFLISVIFTYFVYTTVWYQPYHTTFFALYL